MSKVRVYEVARELGVENRDLIEARRAVWLGDPFPEGPPPPPLEDEDKPVEQAGALQVRTPAAKKADQAEKPAAAKKPARIRDT